MSVMRLFSDQAEMSRVHSLSFEAGWNEHIFHEFMNQKSSLAMGLKKGETLQSFILISIVSEEAEIITLATDPLYQHQGLAHQVLGAALLALRAQNIEALLLEVAVDNLSALKLYQRHGFIEVGRRKAYYARKHQAPQDALIMRLDLIELA